MPEHQSRGKTRTEVPGRVTEKKIVELEVDSDPIIFCLLILLAVNKRDFFSLFIYGLKNVKSGICIKNISKTTDITA